MWLGFAQTWPIWANFVGAKSHRAWPKVGGFGSVNLGRKWPDSGAWFRFGGSGESTPNGETHMKAAHYHGDCDVVGTVFERNYHFECFPIAGPLVAAPPKTATERSPRARVRECAVRERCRLFFVFKFLEIPHDHRPRRALVVNVEPNFAELDRSSKNRRQTDNGDVNAA